MVEISFSKKYSKNYMKFMKKSSFSLQFPDFLEISATIGDFIHAASLWKMKEYQHAAMISVCAQVLMTSFKYFEKIPIFGKCLLYFVPSENISKFLCPMSDV